MAIDKIDRHELTVQRTPTIDPIVESKKGIHWGVAQGQEDKKIAITPQEVADQVTLTPTRAKTEILHEGQELLVDIAKMSPPCFEELMKVVFHMMSKGEEDAWKTLTEEERLAIRRNFEILEANKAAYEGVMRRQQWHKIFDYIGIGGGAVGGVASAVALSAGTAGMAPVVAIVITTAVLTAMHVNNASGDPLGKKVFGKQSPDWYHTMQAVTALSATVVSAFLTGGISQAGSTAALIAKLAPAGASYVASIGGAVMGYQEKAGKATLQEVRANQEERQTAREALESFMKICSARMTDLMRDVRALNRKVEVF